MPSARRSVDDYGAPLLVAWQLTNRCTASCLACCEESGSRSAGAMNSTRGEALELAQQIIDARHPLRRLWRRRAPRRAALLGHPRALRRGGRRDQARDRRPRTSTRSPPIGLAALPRAVRPDFARWCHGGDARARPPRSSFRGGDRGRRSPVAHGTAPQWVFAPTRLNLHEIVAAFDLAVRLGCDAFVTGPLMRLGRAAATWHRLACDEECGRRRPRRCAPARRKRAARRPLDLSVGHRDRARAAPGQPAGDATGGAERAVKLLNALPFAAADLRRDTLSEAWEAYGRAWASREVSQFVLACRSTPSLLSHANETWPLKAAPLAATSA